LIPHIIHKQQSRASSGSPGIADSCQLMSAFAFPLLELLYRNSTF
jgi:hypothetical protein